MKTRDEQIMFGLYQQHQEEKIRNEMIRFISESIYYNPWLLVGDNMELLTEAGAPMADPNVAPVGGDPAAGGDLAAGGQEDPLQPIIDQLSDLSSDELLDLVQRIVVAQQEKQAAMAGEGAGAKGAGMEAAGGMDPSMAAGDVAPQG